MTDQFPSDMPALEVKHLQVNLGGVRILKDISFTLQAGESIAVIGPSASGKTTLINALLNQVFYRGTIVFDPARPRISVISRQHRFNNLSNRSDFYYQQRFNSFDAEDSRTIMEEMTLRTDDMEAVDRSLQQVGLMGKEHTRLIQLSNGEHKRFQIAEALLEKPDWILMDSPYIGLDAGARKMLNVLLDTLMKQGVQLVVVTGEGEVPSGMKLLFLGKVDDENLAEGGGQGASDQHVALRDIPLAYDFPEFETAVRMEEVSISYGERQILDHINWDVKKGECWAVTGPNGSGKSTLLSLINGDNPQAFSQRIWLFDRRKGTGESIWDIKRNIGYISPELHHYFDSGSDAMQIVASGLFDTMGLFRVLHPHHEWLALSWMKVLQVDGLARRPFARLSDSQQRRVLLARALVKHPPLLILDEPCQGMDAYETSAFRELIDEVCTAFGKTLIYVSHYDKDIPACVNHRLVLQDGKRII